MRGGGLRSGRLSPLPPSTRVRWLLGALVVVGIAAIGTSAALADATAEGPDAQVEPAVGAASLVAVPNALPLLEGGTILIAGAGLPPDTSAPIG